MGNILKRMGRTEWCLLLISTILVVCQVWLDLRIPDYMSQITILAKTEGSPIGDIWRAGGMMLLCAVGSMLMTFVSGFVSARLAAEFSRNLRWNIFHTVQRFSLEEIDQFSTASLITRSTNDVTQLQNFVSRGLLMIVRAPITVGIALVKISGKNWAWTSLTSGAVVIILIAIAFVVTYAHPRFRRMQSLTDDLNRAVRENLTGIRIVRAYNAESYQEKKFSDCNDRLTNNAIRAHLAMAVMHPTMRFVNNGLTIGIYAIGAYSICVAMNSGDALETFSEMVVFSNYASRILFSFMSLNFIFMTLPRATVCAERINQVLQTVPSITDGTAEEGIAGQEGTVEFRNVSFRYPGAEDNVLTNISFTAKKGETVAFIGATGSGKTTLVNLVPRFYDVTAGQVLVNGRDVREYTQEALRGVVGYAPQRVTLFTGTVESNVRYGKTAFSESENHAQQQLQAALSIAQASEFVSKMPQQSHAGIARGGANVSGGQKQRLSIARAVFRRPQIYIFDDTFSALDYRTDSVLRSRLKEETAGVTTLLVAQRIGTIRDADKIIVLENGQIAGQGTHSQLLRSCQVYREIAHTQLSEEECN